MLPMRRAYASESVHLFIKSKIQESSSHIEFACGVQYAKSSDICIVMGRSIRTVTVRRDPRGLFRSGSRARFLVRLNTGRVVGTRQERRDKIPTGWIRGLDLLVGAFDQGRVIVPGSERC